MNSLGGVTSDMTIPSTQPHSRQIVAAIIGSIIIALVIGVALPSFPDYGEDTPEYRALAMNQLDQVHQPFSSRFLHAHLIRLTAHSFNLSTDQAAQVVAFAAIALVVAVVAWLYVRLRFSIILLLLAVPSLALVKTFRFVYMPDLFYSLLLGLFFIALLYEQIIMAAVLLVLLFCARESTLMLGVAAVTAALLEKKPDAGSKQWSGKTIAIIFLVATFIGFIVNNRVAGKAAPNIHQVGGLAYLVGKIPFNFAKNILGLDPWTNTLTQSQTPVWQTAVPSWIHLGGITHVGIREVTLFFPLMVIFNFLCTFGVLMTVLIHAVYHQSAPKPDVPKSLIGRLRYVISKALLTLPDAPFYVQLAVVYGLLTLLVAPLIGAAMWRYVFYAWPLYWIVAVWIFQKHYVWKLNGRLGILILAHLIMVWLPLLADRRSVLDGYKTFLAPGILLLTVIAVVLQIIAWRSLDRMRLATA